MLICNNRNKGKNVGPLNVKEIGAAEEYVIKYEQRILSCKKGITRNN